MLKTAVKSVAQRMSQNQNKPLKPAGNKFIKILIIIEIYLQNDNAGW